MLPNICPQGGGQGASDVIPWCVIFMLCNCRQARRDVFVCYLVVRVTSEKSDVKIQIHCIFAQPFPYVTVRITEL